MGLAVENTTKSEEQEKLSPTVLDNLKHLKELQESHPDYFSHDPKLRQVVSMLSPLLDPLGGLLKDLRRDELKCLLNNQDVPDILRHLSLSPELFSFPKDEIERMINNSEYFEKRYKQYCKVEKQLAVATILELVRGANADGANTISENALNGVANFLNARYQFKISNEQIIELSHDSSKFYDSIKDPKLNYYDVEGSYSNHKFHREEDQVQGSLNEKSLHELFKKTVTSNSKFGSDREAINSWINARKNAVASNTNSSEQKKEYQLNLLNSIYNVHNYAPESKQLSFPASTPPTENLETTKQKATGRVFIGANSPLETYKHQLGINYSIPNDKFVSIETLAYALNALVEKTKAGSLDSSILAPCWIGLFNGRSLAEIEQIFTATERINPEIKKDSVIQFLNDKAYETTTYANNFWNFVGLTSPNYEYVMFDYTSKLIQNGWSPELCYKALKDLNDNSQTSSMSIISGLSLEQIKNVSTVINKTEGQGSSLQKFAFDNNFSKRLQQYVKALHSSKLTSDK